MLGYRVGEVFDALLPRLNVDAQSVFDGGGCGYWTNACDHDAGQRVSEIGSVEQLCEIFDGRRTREGDAVTAAGKHRAQLATIEILRHDGLIRWDDVDARAGVFQRFG